MEYTTLWQPASLVFITFSMGIFCGSIWMFYAMYKTNKSLERELDSKTKQLDLYLDKYKDDDYEAY